MGIICLAVIILNSSSDLFMETYEHMELLYLSFANLFCSNVYLAIKAPAWSQKDRRSHSLPGIQESLWTIITYLAQS